MKTVRWMAVFGLAALALVGCGGDDGDGGPATVSYCQAACGSLWDCAPEGTRPGDDRTTYVSGCAFACEIEKMSSCPDIDETSCRACFTDTCVPEPACALCNCFLFMPE